MKFCPDCGVNYTEDTSFGIEHCGSPNHYPIYRCLDTWQHERVKLVSSSYEEGGYYAGDAGTVVDVCGGRHSRVGMSIRMKWDSGAEECWIDVDDCCPLEFWAVEGAGFVV